MYLRKSTRRHLHRAGFLLLALVLLAPKLDVPAMPQLATIFHVAVLGQPRIG